MTNVILFDGVCNFCNNSINFIIDRDPNGVFKFASLQSEVGQQLLNDNGLKTSDFDSIVLLKNGKVFQKSVAALEIARELTAPWSWLYIFKIFPAVLRDFFYDIIAKNRYRWFGKLEACRIPTPDLRARFLG
ncbi:MAG: thiol-disulfide oxidoreductase DCC family protein [Spirosomataceae bacterium]